MECKQRMCQYCGIKSAKFYCSTCPTQPGLHAPLAASKEKFGAAVWPCFAAFHNEGSRQHCKLDCKAFDQPFLMDPAVAAISNGNNKRQEQHPGQMSAFASAMIALPLTKKPKKGR